MLYTYYFQFVRKAVSSFAKLNSNRFNIWIEKYSVGLMDHVAFFSKDSLTVSQVEDYCRQHDVKFVDPDFPANDDSLYKRTNGNNDIASAPIQWRRPRYR